MKEKRITVYECDCLKCGYQWTTNKSKKPIQCPSCKQKQWWKPRTRSTNNNLSLPEAEREEIKTDTQEENLPSTKKENKKFVGLD